MLPALASLLLCTNFLTAQPFAPRGLSAEIGGVAYWSLARQRSLESGERRLGGGVSAGAEAAVAYAFGEGWRAEVGIAFPHDRDFRWRLAEFNRENSHAYALQVWQVPVRLERTYPLGLFSRFRLGPQIGLALTRRQFHTVGLDVSEHYNAWLDEKYQLQYISSPLGPAHRWQAGVGVVLACHVTDRLALRLVGRYATPLGRGDVVRTTLTYTSASRPHGISYESRTRLAAFSAGLSVAYHLPVFVIRPLLRDAHNEGGQR